MGEVPFFIRLILPDFISFLYSSYKKFIFYTTSKILYKFLKPIKLLGKIFLREYFYGDYN